MLKRLIIWYQKLSKRYQESNSITFDKEVEYQMLQAEKIKLEKVEKISKLQHELKRLDYMI